MNVGAGSVPGKTAPAVVFIHGQPGSGGDFAEVILRLPSYIRTVTYDRPGWGEALNPVGDLSANALFLSELLHTEELSPVVVVGYSYGAAVAIRVALDFPELICGMILVAPVGSVGSFSKADSVLANFGGVIKAMTVLKRWLGADIARSLASFHAEQVQLWQDLSTLPIVLDRIAVPVTLLAGRDDWLNPVGGTLKLHDGIRGSRLRMIPRSGHLIMLQSPAEIAVEILEMLALLGNTP